MAEWHESYNAAHVCAALVSRVTSAEDFPRCCSQLEFMRPLTAAILSERRTVAPFGIAGGCPAKRGLNLVVKKDGHTINIGAKSVVKLQVWVGGAVEARFNQVLLSAVALPELLA